MKINLLKSLLAALMGSLTLVGCSSSSGGGDSGGAAGADLAIMNRIDDNTGFLVAIDSQKNTAISNANGVELNPSTGITGYNGFVYTTGSLGSNKVAKYSFDGTVFTKEAELDTGENTLPTVIIFANENKAYVNLVLTGELLAIDPGDLSIKKRIDLSSYALGDGDISPEPSDGVIRNGKLYLALGQVDSMQTFQCQAGASVLIIDVATDAIEKHIQDDRTCSSGMMQPSGGLILDEMGDIYVQNPAGYGFHPGKVSGFLRIKSGADEFDPDYFFPITGMETNLPSMPAAYSYLDNYAGDGMLYSTLFIPALSSNPPDFVNDKNYLPYRLDLRNKTATRIDIPATAGWSASVIKHKDKIIYGLLTDNGGGLYRYDPSSGTDTGDQTPYITTAGSPVWLASF